ncbi:hypothetical protein V8C34DRAFT_83743 [Trichoderma compactum]
MIPACVVVLLRVGTLSRLLLAKATAVSTLVPTGAVLCLLGLKMERRRKEKKQSRRPAALRQVVGLVVFFSFLFFCCLSHTCLR